MSPDERTEFEQALNRIPLRDAPPDLRREILCGRQTRGFSGSILSWLRFLWQVPTPIRLAAAIVWLAALMVTISTPRENGRPAGENLSTSSRHFPAPFLAIHLDRIDRTLESVN